MSYSVGARNSVRAARAFNYQIISPTPPHAFVEVIPLSGWWEYCCNEYRSMWLSSIFCLHVPFISTQYWHLLLNLMVILFFSFRNYEENSFECLCSLCLNHTWTQVDSLTWDMTSDLSLPHSCAFFHSVAFFTFAQVSECEGGAMLAVELCRVWEGTRGWLVFYCCALWKSWFWSSEPPSSGDWDNINWDLPNLVSHKNRRSFVYISA